MRYYEDIAVGEEIALGSHTFPAEEIVAFASQWDFQRFHIEDEAARSGPFGALTASGWHTACTWMRLLVDRAGEFARDYEAAGERPPRAGGSPGFTNLVWKRPVYAGDTVSYAVRVTGKRPLASRPGWGLVTSRNTGVNQHGELAFAFDGNSFTEMRGR